MRDQKNNMNAYAQTNVQLYQQLRSAGYSDAEREYIRHVYTFGVHLFTGLYLPSGKPFIDHLVGTASILVWLQSPISVVAAGLIHAAYLHGDFGCRTGISDGKRKQIIKVVGPESEEYITRYDRFLLTAQDIAALEMTLQQLGAIDRYVVTARLANELEHHLDFGGLYFVEGEKRQAAHRRYLEGRFPALVKLANDLGYASLAAEFENVWRQIAALKLPLEPVIASRQKVAYLIAPKSHKVRMTVAVPRLVTQDVPDRAQLLYGRVSRFAWLAKNKIRSFRHQSRE
jgi:hypothetical protein